LTAIATIASSPRSTRSTAQLLPSSAIRSTIRSRGFSGSARRSVFRAANSTFRPGYHYFACVCDFVALSLAVRGELSHFFAEAIASHMARGFISIVAMTKHLDAVGTHYEQWLSAYGSVM
jgi:hypothetical protein